MNGAAAEADDRLVGVELPPDDADRLEDRRHGGLGVGHLQLLDRGRSPDRLANDRPYPLDELDVDAHRDDRGHDVREHHRCVDPVPLHRLQRDLGGQLRRAVDLEERVLLANRPVLGQRAPRLPHEPGRGPLGRLTPCGAHEERVHVPRLAAHDARPACRPLGGMGARRASRRHPDDGPGHAREHRNGHLARQDRPQLPLARRPRQPNRVGRTEDVAARRRARRARERRGGRPGPDPPGALRLRLRPRRRGHRLARGAGQRARTGRGRRRPAAGRASRRAAGLGRARPRLGRSGSPPPTPRASASLPGRSPGRAGSRAGGRPSSRRTSRGPAGSPASRTRSSARR